MTPTVRVGAVARAARSLSIEGTRALDAKRAALGYDQLQELDQQVQVEISGTAAEVASSVVGQVKFDVGFVDATEQRWSAYTVPHFTYGVTILQLGDMKDGSPAIGVPQVTAAVLAWVERPGPVIIGAKLAVTAAFPGLKDESIQFSGYLHCNFQGYGALEDNDSEDIS